MNIVRAEAARFVACNHSCLTAWRGVRGDVTAYSSHLLVRGTRTTLECQRLVGRPKIGKRRTDLCAHYDGVFRYSLASGVQRTGPAHWTLVVLQHRPRTQLLGSSH